MLSKLLPRFCPLAERLGTSQGRYRTLTKKLRPFHTISFRVAMQELIDNECFEELGIAEHI